MAPVLIVDDSLTVRMDLMDAFASAGIQATASETLAHARDVLASQEISLTVLDALLPDGHGIDLAEEIRASDAHKGMPILMLSSESEVRDRIRGLSLGLDDYIGKPYNLDYVVARVRELLGRHQPGEPQKNLTVLIIEDSMTFLEALRYSLETSGYQVLSAGSGEEGLKLAASHRPAALIVDSELPGMDGVTVVRKIRLDAALRKTPCLMLTAAQDQHAELRALDAGADAFVRKDQGLDMVQARLAAVLRASSEAPSASASLMSAKKILAVDDSLVFLDALNFALSDQGYDIILAASADEALELLSVQAVDCILLDRSMPGTDGNELCRRIKASVSTRDIPLIMLTAEESHAAVLESLGQGADDYVLKSSDWDVLKARVRAQLRRKQFEEESRHIRLKLLHTQLQVAEAQAQKELAETRAALSDELERRNQELQMANKELEAFSYSVSHDLRAPLRTIQGFSQILQEDYGTVLDAEGSRLLQQVMDASLRMNQLIDDLLSFSRVGRQPLHSANVEMTPLVYEVVKELTPRYPNARIDITELPLTIGTRALLRQVWVNLIDNALKYSSKTAEPCVTIGGKRTADDTEYWVHDNGAGFNPQYIEKLFGVFQRLHSVDEFPGTGVGLALTQRIVMRHGGRIWAEGQVNGGARFHFVLPMKG